MSRQAKTHRLLPHPHDLDAPVLRRRHRKAPVPRHPDALAAPCSHHRKLEVCRHAQVHDGGFQLELSCELLAGLAVVVPEPDPPLRLVLEHRASGDAGGELGGGVCGGLEGVGGSGDEFGAVLADKPGKLLQLAGDQPVFLADILVPRSLQPLRLLQEGVHGQPVVLQDDWQELEDEADLEQAEAAQDVDEVSLPPPPDTVETNFASCPRLQVGDPPAPQPRGRPLADLVELQPLEVPQKHFRHLPVRLGFRPSRVHVPRPDMPRDLGMPQSHGTVLAHVPPRRHARQQRPSCVNDSEEASEGELELEGGDLSPHDVPALLLQQTPTSD
eukprot:478223-Hanusia_phi.AAC.2